LLLLPSVGVAADPPADPRPVAAAWVAQVREAVRSTGASAVVVGRQRVAVDELDGDDLPIPALSMLGALAPSTADDYGRVLQWWIRLPGVPVTPVRVLLAGDEVRVEVGPATSPRRASSTPDELARRWGLGKMTADGAPFSDAMLAGLEAGLPLLTPGERARIGGVRFVAMPTDPRHAGRAAVYRGGVDGEPGTVELYADVIGDGGQWFSGCARRPLPGSVQTVLHELGHALAEAPARVARARLAAVRRGIEARQRAEEHAWADYERAARDARPSAVDRDGGAWFTEALATWRRRLVAEHAAIAAAWDAYQAGVARVAADEDGGPVVAAYARLAGALDGPTPYGRTNPEESFAEAFALWHTDPDAVALLWPDVARWFAAGGHLATAHAAVAGLAEEPALAPVAGEASAGLPRSGSAG
jgi:hypothetical protein